MRVTASEPRTAEIPVAATGAAPAPSATELAESDGLTGLMNRRAFMVQAIDAMRYYKRYGRSIAILALDIDRFGQVNRAYGTVAGDAVIGKVATVVAQMVRATDKVGRNGGAEFMVLLREIDAEQTRLLAERILKRVESAAVIHGGDAIGVTLSIGAAVVSKQDRDVEDLIERADRALYAAKDAGRNCVRMAAPADPKMRAA
jgi:diguanylate cyclase (GGDEF)-like protein